MKITCQVTIGWYEFSYFEELAHGNLSVRQTTSPAQTTRSAPRVIARASGADTTADLPATPTTPARYPTLG
jgi:hypothetical protein